MHIKIPRFQLAHLGSISILAKIYPLGVYWPEGGGGSRLFLLQSAQLLLPSSLRRLLIVCVFCAARSAAGFGGLRDMLIIEACTQTHENDALFGGDNLY